MALLHLLKNFGMGGGRWRRQFTHGFHIAGAFEQKGVFPLDDSAPGPPSIDKIFDGNMGRFRRRSLASGALNAVTLRGEAMGQAEMCWISDPKPLGDNGALAAEESYVEVFSFRFGVKQMDMVRSRDDLKYSTANQY